MLNNVIWSFTSEDEKNDAERELGKANVVDYVIAQDIPRMINFDEMVREARAYKKKRKT